MSRFSSEQLKNHLTWAFMLLSATSLMGTFVVFVYFSMTRDAMLGLFSALVLELASTLSLYLLAVLMMSLVWLTVGLTYSRRTGGPDNVLVRIFVWSGLFLVMRFILMNYIPDLAVSRDPTAVKVNSISALLVSGFIVSASWTFYWIQDRHVPVRLVKLTGLGAGAVWLFCIVSMIAAAGTTTGFNVVVVTVDCLRADYLRANNPKAAPLPNIDEFSLTSDRWTRAYSPSSWTKPAVVSLLTGLSPFEHGVLKPMAAVPDSLKTIADELRNENYDAFFINGGNAFLDRSFNLDASFSDYVFVNEVAGVRAVVNRFKQITSDLHRPFFAYLHLMDAHLPYRHQPQPYFVPGKGLVSPPRIPPDLEVQAIREATVHGEITEGDKRHIRELYSYQLQQIDQGLGDLFKWLKESNIWDSTVIVITSDHGEEFWEHGGFEHGHSLYEELVHIPLLIKFPGTDSSRHDEVVSLTDIKSMLLSAVRGEVPDKESGPVPLVSTLYGPRLLGSVDAVLKFIRVDDDHSTGWAMADTSPVFPMVFDLNVDPGEKSNLYSRNATSTAKLEARLVELLSIQKDVAPAVVDDEIRRNLRSLGYTQ